MRYDEAIKSAIIPLNIPLFHNYAHKQSTRYMVWSETDASGLNADGKTVNGKIRLALDFFSKREYEDYDAIRAALENVGFAVGDVVIDFEKDTGFTHYAYTAEWSG